MSAFLLVVQRKRAAHMLVRRMCRLARTARPRRDAVVRRAGQSPYPSSPRRGASLARTAAKLEQPTLVERAHSLSGLEPATFSAQRVLTHGRVLAVHRLALPKLEHPLGARTPSGDELATNGFDWVPVGGQIRSLHSPGATLHGVACEKHESRSTSARTAVQRVTAWRQSRSSAIRGSMRPGKHQPRPRRRRLNHRPA